MGVHGIELLASMEYDMVVYSQLRYNQCFTDSLQKSYLDSSMHLWLETVHLLHKLQFVRVQHYWLKVSSRLSEAPNCFPFQELFSGAASNRIHYILIKSISFG